MEANGFLIKSFSTGVKFSIKALLEDIKPIVVKKSGNIEMYQIRWHFLENSDQTDYDAKHKTTIF